MLTQFGLIRRAAMVFAIVFCGWLGLAVAPAHAALIFTFSFTNNVDGGIASTVTGTISGLVDNTDNQPATSVVITSAVGLGGVPRSGLASDFDALTWNNVFDNSFNVSAGAITAAVFTATDNSGDSADLDQLCIAFSGSCGGITGANSLLTYNRNTDFIANNGGFEGVTFTPVPVPAALWLFGSGLLGLIGMARCKKAA